jgi:hypothetical protein
MGSLALISKYQPLLRRSGRSREHVGWPKVPDSPWRALRSPAPARRARRRPGVHARHDGRRPDPRRPDRPAHRQEAGQARRETLGRQARRGAIERQGGPGHAPRSVGTLLGATGRAPAQDWDRNTHPTARRLRRTARPGRYNPGGTDSTIETSPAYIPPRSAPSWTLLPSSLEAPARWTRRIHRRRTWIVRPQALIRHCTRTGTPYQASMKIESCYSPSRDIVSNPRERRPYTSAAPPGCSELVQRSRSALRATSRRRGRGHGTRTRVHGSPSCASQIARPGYAAWICAIVASGGADRYSTPSNHGPLRA